MRAAASGGREIVDDRRMDSTPWYKRRLEGRWLFAFIVLWVIGMSAALFGQNLSSRFVGLAIVFGALALHFVGVRRSNDA